MVVHCIYWRLVAAYFMGFRIPLRTSYNRYESIRYIHASAFEHHSLAISAIRCEYISRFTLFACLTFLFHSVSCS